MRMLHAGFVLVTLVVVAGFIIWQVAEPAVVEVIFEDGGGVGTDLLPAATVGDSPLGGH